MKSFSQGQALTNHTPTGHSLHCVRSVGVVMGAVFKKTSMPQEAATKGMGKVIEG